MASELKTDGTYSFYGGMDLSRVSYEIDERQFAKGVNLSITTVGDNIQPRPGWHWQTVQWRSPLEQQRFEEGHVQGGSWYFDGNSDCLVVSVSGLIFFFNQKTQGHWYGKALNLGNPNNSTRTKVYCCRIPGNRLILSDGQVLPFVLGQNGDFIRPDPGQNQMGICKMMCYVQNRLWWVNEFGTELYGSDLVDPLSIQEGIDTNLPYFVPPDDRDTITAVGTQRFLGFDQNGGELVFSTINNVYAVNVPASVPREFWGTNNVGMVRLVIPETGATSAYSFENFNTNLFFRSQANGVVNYKQLQAQWMNNDELISNSIEVDYWYKRDTSWMLDQCWTVNFKGRLLTTVSPTLANGYCYWRGLIAFNPAPYYGPVQRLPRRFEGLWTGCRPWCLLHQQGSTEKLFTVSYDGDQKNRIYELVEDRYDIGPEDVRKDIECILETRSYSFDSIYNLKSWENSFYTLDQITSDVKVSFFSRSSLSGAWQPFYDITHQVGKCCPTQERTDDQGNKYCFPWNITPPESRNGWVLAAPAEKTTTGGKVDRFYARQLRLEAVGQFELSAIGASATIQPGKNNVIENEGKRVTTIEPICSRKDFDYFVVSPKIIPPYPGAINNARRPNDTASAGNSACGC